jgi:hypothetical protein
MTQINTFRAERPSGARRAGASRLATRRTRVRVSSDAVVSAYIRDLALPHAGREQHDPRPVFIPLSVPEPYGGLDDPDARHLRLRNEDC